MRLYSHFSPDTLSNSYLLGPDAGGDAILVDPSAFDVTLLETIEGLGYYVRSILLTHLDENHLAGLNTIRRIYDCTVYATHIDTVGREAVQIVDGESLDICCEPIQVMTLPGMSSDSVAYAVGGFLFTGRAMSAGECGTVINPYAKALLLANIQSRVLALPQDTVILPFVGPPSTVAIERVTFPMDVPTLPEAPL